MPKKYPKLAALLMAALIAISVLTGCNSSNSTANITTGSTAAAAEPTAIAVQYSSEDLDSAWDPASASAITLQGNSIAAAGAGAAAQGSILTIKAGVTISGTVTRIADDGSAVTGGTGGMGGMGGPGGRVGNMASPNQPK